MKRLALLSLSLFAVSVGGAAQFAYDSFTSVADPTNPSNGEYDDDLSLTDVSQAAPSVSVADIYEHGWTGNWILDLGTSPDSPELVGATGLNYVGVPSTGGSVESAVSGRAGRVLATAYTDSSEATVYISFMMRANNNSGYAGFELHDGSLDNGDRKVQIGYGENGSDDFAVRLFNNDTAGFYGSIGAHNLDVNFCVAKITLSTVNDEDRIEVWFNPSGSELSSEGAAGAPDYDLAGFNLSFDRTAIHNFGSAAAWDELCLGDSWEDVVPRNYAYDSFSAASVPTAGEYDDDLLLVNAAPTQVAPSVDVAGVYLHGWTGDWLLQTGTAADVLGSTDLSYTGINTAGGSVKWSGDVNGRVGRLLASPVTGASSGTVYMSFLMQVDDTNSTYRAFELHNGGLEDGDRQVQIGILTEEGSSDYAVRLFNTNTIGFLGSLGAINTAVNLVVVKFTLGTSNDADRIDVWFNPSGNGLLSEVAAGAPDFSKDTFNLSFDRSSLSNFGSNAAYDELRVGSSWADVSDLSTGLVVPILDIVTSGGDADISFTAVDGLSYQLQKRSSLTSGTWSNVAGEVVTNSGGGIEILTDTAAVSANTTGFYRVVVIR